MNNHKIYTVYIGLLPVLYYMALTSASPAARGTGDGHNADLADAQTALYGVLCSAVLSGIQSCH
jgi:hypothetical protein